MSGVSLSPPRVSQSGPLAQVNRPDASSGPKGGEGLGRIKGQVRTPIQSGLGKQYTTWGTNRSFSSTLGSILRWPGKQLQNMGRSLESSGHNIAGGVVKGTGHFLAGVAGFIAGTLNFAESTVSHLGGFALRLAGASVLGLGSGLAAICGQLDTAGKLGKEACDLVANTPLLSRGKQKDATVDVARQFQWDAEFVSQSSPSKNARFADVSDFSSELREKFDIRQGSTMIEIHSGSWSDVTAFAAWDTRNKDPNDPNDKGTLVINFRGSVTAANWRTDASQALGIADSGYREARHLIEGLAKQYGADKVRVIGHSMGGGMAQYAGIAAGVPVTAFNAAGLHVHLRDKLGADRIDRSNVTHFNTSGDFLSQAFEGRRFGLDASSQIGTRYVVPGGGHHFNTIANHLDDLIKKNEPLPSPPSEEELAAAKEKAEARKAQLRAEKEERLARRARMDGPGGRNVGKLNRMLGEVDTPPVNPPTEPS